MDANAEDRWLSRQELADRYGVPVKTPAEWATKGTGPRYAKFGRHVRYRLSDVIDWESKQFAETSAAPPDYHGPMVDHFEAGTEARSARLRSTHVPWLVGLRCESGSTAT